MLKNHLFGLALIVTTLSLVACGNDADNVDAQKENKPLLSAATLGAQQILTVAAYLELEQYSTANGRNGASQAQICKACHSVNAGGPNMIGPALFEMFGRRAGERPGFDYSPVLRNADFVWTPRALDAWMAQPGRFLPGNRMSFAGVFRQSDRNDLIAYLLVATSEGNGD